MKFITSKTAVLALSAFVIPSSNAFTMQMSSMKTQTDTRSFVFSDTSSSLSSTISSQNGSKIGRSNVQNSSLSKARSPLSNPNAVPTATPDTGSIAVPFQDVSPFTNPRTTQEIFDEITPVIVQGASLRVCSFAEHVERISINLKTIGRPLNANVELWHGPDHTPQKMSVYLEDGDLRPFRAIVECPGSSNAVAIRNTGQMEFPLTAGLEVDTGMISTPGTISRSPSDMLIDHPLSQYRPIQGGAVYTNPFPPNVESVQIALKSDGRPINARVELLQGPNNNKEILELYSEDGMDRPFFVIIETPGDGNVVRIVNTATVEFPLIAAIEPYLVDDEIMEGDGMSWGD